ncbi:Ribosomal protein S6 kinase alpha-5 [Tyrophagus putrescentiae]|nr:Ribosomal protein S6 kinase alpha-5 [Tyrophagus putrescentiae]
MAKRTVDMTDFEILKVLGTGAYGKVFLVRKIGGSDHGKLYAMKVLKKASIVLKQKTLEHTKTERQVLENIRHTSFLVTVHYAFQTATKLHLILDYVSGGELFTHLYQRDSFTEDAVRIYAGELILALESLHKRGIIYRDIKLENILLDSEGHIVLTDFGLCKQFLPHETEQRTFSFCGTIEYMAPEIVRGGPIGHDYSVDWWSFGVLIYELLTGASPFTVEGEKNTQQEISRRILRSNPPFPNNLSAEVMDLLKLILVKDPRKRLGGGWDDLAARRLPAPFTPKISNELDVSNFSEEFTSMVPKVSLLLADSNNNPNGKQGAPATTDQAGLEELMEDADLFRGYSFVTPSVVLEDGLVVAQKSPPLDASPAAPAVTAAATLAQTNSRRLKPDIAKLVDASKSGSLQNEFFQKYHLMPDTAEGAALNDNDWLGDGSFSVCCRCVHKYTNVAYAVKILSRHRRRDSVTGAVYDVSLQEETLLRQCQGHPNIVALKEVFQDESHTYIVLELLRGGELLSRIRERRRFSEAEAKRVFQQLVWAVGYLHTNGIVHRDLKPENVLFLDSTDDHVKLVDFGFARSFTGANGELMRTPCCTLNYAAPEVLHQAISKSHTHSLNLKKKNYSSLYSTNGYDSSCDAWSLGTVLFTMFTGRIPFQSYALKKHDASGANFILEKIIAEDEFNLDGPLWSSYLNLSSQAKSVINGLLTVNPAQRLTISQLMRHPWLSETVESPMLQPFQVRCPCKESGLVCFYGSSCPNGVSTVASSTTLSHHHTSATSTSLSSSSGSAGRSTEDSLPKCSLNERKRTLKMKLKKKHTITSPRKNGKKSKVVDHFEVLNSEGVEEEELAQAVDTRIEVVYSNNKVPSATSYNSAYDSGIQSLSSHHQSCSTTSSGSSTGSRGSNGTTGFYNPHLDQANQANTKCSLSLSSTSSRLSLQYTNAQSTGHSVQPSTATAACPLLSQQQHLMSTAPVKVPLPAKETSPSSSDMAHYSPTTATYSGTPYSTNLAMSHRSEPYREAIVPANKVTAYLATLKEECDSITETSVINHRPQQHCTTERGQYGSVFDSKALLSCNTSQPTQTKRFKRSDSPTVDNQVKVELPLLLPHVIERSNHQRQQQQTTLTTMPVSGSDLNPTASNDHLLTSSMRETGKRTAFESTELQRMTKQPLPTLYNDSSLAANSTNSVRITNTNCKSMAPKTRRQKRPRPPTIVLDD